MLLSLVKPDGKAFNDVAHPAMSFNGWHNNRQNNVVLHINNPSPQLIDWFGTETLFANTLYLESEELLNFVRQQQICGYLDTNDFIFFQRTLAFFEPQPKYSSRTLN